MREKWVVLLCRHENKQNKGGDDEGGDTIASRRLQISEWKREGGRASFFFMVTRAEEFCRWGKLRPVAYAETCRRRAVQVSGRKGGGLCSWVKQTETKELCEREGGIALGHCMDCNKARQTEGIVNFEN